MTGIERGTELGVLASGVVAAVLCLSPGTLGAEEGVPAGTGQTQFVGAAAREQLRDPKQAMPTEIEAELRRMLEDVLHKPVRALVGPHAEVSYEAVTTLNEDLHDLSKLDNRLSITVNTKDAAGKELFFLYAALHMNEAHPEYYELSAADRQREIDIAKKNDANQRKNAAQRNTPYKPSVMTMANGQTATVYHNGYHNGWKWRSTDMRVQVTMWSLDRSVTDEQVTQMAHGFDETLDKAGFYTLRTRLMGASEEAGLSDAAAEARAGVLLAALEAWEKTTGRRVVFAGRANMKRVSDHLKLEDGVVEPLRSGQEVAFYNRLKQFASTRDGGKVLKMDDLLTIGLEVTPVAKDNTVNLYDTLLTVHNTMRLLARPEQWLGELTGTKEADHFGHPNTDPAKPIMLDLLGRGSSGGTAFPKIMASTLNVRCRANGEVYSGNWCVDLFGPTGIFQSQPGIHRSEPEDRNHWNGGCNYYYWIGAIAYPTLGSLGVWYGGRGEQSAKGATATALRGKVEISYFKAGAKFTEKVMALLKTR